jgi:hypothetical protein
MRKYLVMILVAVSLQACARMNDPSIPSTDEINRLEIAMRRLGAAVQGLLWSSGAKQDGDLIAAACATDASLCSPFGKNKPTVRVVSGNAVLLLCTPDNKRALVEDIACTPTPDFKAWASGNKPCQFSLSDQAVRDACR